MNLQQFQSNVSQLKNKLFRFSVRIVGHAAEAEDVVQEVFIKLWNNREFMDELSNLEAWCMSATKNLSIDKLRSKHRRLEPIKAGFNLLDKTPTPYQKTVESDVFFHVKSMMDGLPEKQKFVMHLRDIEGLTYQEIAEALGIPLDQVRVNLFRARKSVRERLVKTGIVQTPSFSPKIDSNYDERINRKIL